jgi:tetratricopeptide (TPR) repeat protein
VEAAPADATSHGVRRDIGFDRAEVTFLRGRNDEAAGLIREVRRIPDASDADRIRIDLLEGRIAHANGRFDEASNLYSEAFNAARHCGSLSEEAAAANYMGNAARDAGRYAEAEASFRRALDVWTQTGKTESVAGAHNNLANLAMSRGDDAAARHHYGEALTTFRIIGHTAGCAIALMNLAILANECGDPAHAIARADEALGHLRMSGNQALLGVATVIKGEAQLEAGLLPGARASFEAVLDDSTLAAQPLAIAGAQRGLGRVALTLGEIETARQSLDQAVAHYAALRRVQEEARTKLYLAQALDREGRHGEAEATLQSARQTLCDIGAERDLARSASFVLQRSAQ